MGAEASSNLMTFSTHLLAFEPDYDNEKYKVSPQFGIFLQKDASVIFRTISTVP